MTVAQFTIDDPLGKDMLVHSASSHYKLSASVKQWLTDNVGPMNHKLLHSERGYCSYPCWFYTHSYNELHLWFSDPRHAVMFKLMHA